MSRSVIAIRRFFRSAGLLAGVVVLLLTVKAGVVSGQNAEELVQWTYYVSKSEEDSSAYELRVEAAIADGWKLYAYDSPRPSRGIRFIMDLFPPGVKPGKVVQSTPERGFDPGFKKDVSFFKKSAEFVIPVEYTWTHPEPPVVGGIIYFQICNDDIGLCLPPTRHKFSFEFVASDKPCVNDAAVDCEVEALDFGSPPIQDEGGGDLQPDPGDESPFESHLNAFSDPSIPASSSGPRKSLAGFLLLAIAAGFGALLTPCVFPMIPLTVSYFTSGNRSRTQAARLAGFFGFSIVILFTVLGLLLAIFVGASGSQVVAANPFVNLTIGLVLIVFALSLLGLYEFRLPSRFVNAVNNRATNSSGWMGALLLGLTVTLVSFSCTAPFVGSLLAIAASGSWIRPLLGMIGFSLAFAAPFVVLALFPTSLARLPKSGSWLQTFKVVLGFIELAAAIKFISNADLVFGLGLLSRPIAIAIAFAIFLATSAYLFGWLKLPRALAESRARISAARLGWGVAFGALALYLIPGFLGAPLRILDSYLPPRHSSDIQLLAGIDSDFDIASDEKWIVDDLETALANAARSQKPLFIDFTGYTCTNCRQMEANVFVKTEISEKLVSDFILLRLITDSPRLGPQLQKYQLRLTGTTALPTYVVLDSSGETILDKQSGMMTVDEFSNFLETGARRNKDLLAQNQN